MSRRWYVLSTHSRAEYLAAKELERDDFEIFFPRVKATNQRFGHDDAPLFPGYIFLRFDPTSPGWPTFRAYHRILGFVRVGEEIPWVPDQFIEDVKNSLNSINSGKGPWRRYLKGETVQVVAGNLDTLAQVLEEAKSPESRVKVLLQFMGGLVQAQVPWMDLRPVNSDIPEKCPAPRRTRGRGRWIQGFGPRALASTQSLG